MSKNKGFTLIEMLIVIAVIGILAVAVLSAINPIEQMRKARDTRRRSNAAELLNALERYYSTNEEYPTDYTAAAGVGTDGAAAVGAGALTGGDLSLLITSNELKAEFSDRIEDPGDELYGAIDAGGTDLAVVCYEIESKANQDKYSNEPNYYSSAGSQYVCLPE